MELRSIDELINYVNTNFPKSKIMIPHVRFGHLATNLILTSTTEDVVKDFLQLISRSKLVKKYEIVNKFINIFIDENAILQLNLKPQIAKSDNKKINLEFLSPNPTGPLHLGHCRNAVIGDVLGEFLKFIGYDVTKELYFNNIGVQIEKFLETIQYYRGDTTKTVHYKGDYMIDLANTNIPMDKILDHMIETIMQTVKKLNIEFDVRSYESVITQTTTTVISELEKFGMVYDMDGKKLLKSTDIGDDQDRVLIRENNVPTYAGNDIAYHKNKLDRGFTKQILVLGMDHAGYFARLKAGLVPFKIDLTIIPFNSVKILNEQNEKTKISKRGGNIITVEDLLLHVDSEVIRTEMLSKSYLQEMGLSIDKIIENKGLAFYIKYANARINSFKAHINNDVKIDLAILQDQYSQILIQKVIEWPIVLVEIHNSYDMHKLFNFLYVLCQDIHSFLSNIQVLNDAEPTQTQSKITLLLFIQQILKYAAGIIKIQLPTKI